MGRKPSASPFWNYSSNAVVDDASILGVVRIEVVKTRLSHLLRLEVTNSNLVRRNERSEVDMNRVYQEDAQHRSVKCQHTSI